MLKKINTNNNHVTEYVLIPEITHTLLCDLLNSKLHIIDKTDGLDIGAGVVAANLLENYLVPNSDAAILFYAELCPDETKVQLDEEALWALNIAEKYLLKHKKEMLSYNEKQYVKDALHAFTEAKTSKYCNIRNILFAMALAYGQATNYTYSDRKTLQETAARIIALFRCKNGWKITEQFFIEVQRMYDICRIAPGVEEDAFRLFYDIEKNLKKSHLQ